MLGLKKLAYIMFGTNASFCHIQFVLFGCWNIGQGLGFLNAFMAAGCSNYVDLVIYCGVQWVVTLVKLLLFSTALPNNAAATQARKFISFGKPNRPPVDGLTLREWRGYELLVESACSTNAFASLAVLAFVAPQLTKISPPAVMLETLCFPFEGSVTFILIMWASDFLQDLCISFSVGKITGRHFGNLLFYPYRKQNRQAMHQAIDCCWFVYVVCICGWLMKSFGVGVFGITNQNQLSTGG